ncbi:MAG: type III-B CRISPR-associated protein Cas10/Cmr2 [Aggregatilineales bacterium]
MTHLYLFQIGPVQAFIAQARRTQDLLVGSRILSDLASAGIKAAMSGSKFQAIFPALLEGQRPKSVPHKFAFIADDEPEKLAPQVEQAIRKLWRERYSQPVKQLVKERVGSGSWEAQFDAQAENWLEFYWVAMPDYDPEKHAEAYKRATAALNQRKYARHFPQMNEPGVKCTLTGAQAALDLPWKKLSDSFNDNNITIRPNEKLGTLALIKRLVAETPQYPYKKEAEDFPSTDDIAADRKTRQNEASEGKEVSEYLAVLHMDGDQMGMRLSQLKTLKQNQEFSRDLSRFAEESVPAIVKQHGGTMGRLVYAGGDDVLALLPLSHALACANEIRWQFYEQTGCKMSAGIAVTPANLPLSIALDLARQAEEMAKEEYGRNALVVTEAHGTGQMRSAGSQWQLEPQDSEQVFVMQVMSRMQDYFANKHISSKLGYDVQQIAHDLGTPNSPNEGYKQMLSAMRRAELERILKRRFAEGLSDKLKEAILALVPDLVAIGDAYGWDSLANWLILVRFLATGGQRDLERTASKEGQA